MSQFEEGTILSTKDGQRFTNAVIVGEVDEDSVIVLSDFGNIMKFRKDELFNYYTISDNYVDAMLIDYPLPSVTERIKEQIELLQLALLKLR